MMDEYLPDDIVQAKINLETAQIPWLELQRFFASGKAIAVDSSLDLTEVARVIARDQSAQLKQWMDASLVGSVSDKQAQIWYERNALVWAVVIKPWVLVQDVLNEQTAPHQEDNL
jgi:hypothetical protein